LQIYHHQLCNMQVSKVVINRAAIEMQEYCNKPCVNIYAAGALPLPACQRRIKMLKITAIALAASLFATSTASANESEVQTRAVKTRDLNLARPEGRETLMRRINFAARNVCRDGASTTGIGLYGEQQCVKDAIDGTRVQVARLLNAAGSEVAMLNDKPNQ
jgi:UrcA family protein